MAQIWSPLVSQVVMAHHIVRITNSSGAHLLTPQLCGVIPILIGTLDEESIPVEGRLSEDPLSSLLLEQLVPPSWLSVAIGISSPFHLGQGQSGEDLPRKT